MVEEVTLRNSVDSFFEDRLEKLRPNTQRAYKRGLKRSFSNLLRKLMSIQIQQFQKSPQNGSAILLPTLKIFLRPLNMFFYKLQLHGVSLFQKNIQSISS